MRTAASACLQCRAIPCLQQGHWHTTARFLAVRAIHRGSFGPYTPGSPRAWRKPWALRCGEEIVASSSEENYIYRPSHHVTFHLLQSCAFRNSHLRPYKSGTCVLCITMAKTLLIVFCFAFTLCFGTTWALFPFLQGTAGHTGPSPAHQSFERLARAPPYSMEDIAARHNDDLKFTHRMARMIGSAPRPVAMCGKNSPDKAKCPLNVCCSGAGFCGVCI